MTPGILNMKCFEIRKNIEERWDCITVKIMTYSTAWSLSYGIADNLNKDVMDVFILWYIYIIWEFRRNVPNLKDNAGWPIKKCVYIRINSPYSLCKTI